MDDRVAAANPSPRDEALALAAHFERQAALHPSRVALGSGTWQPTYEQLNAAANRLSQTLLASGGAGGDRVALLMRHDTPLIAAVIAVLKAGRTAVVLNSTDPPQRLEQVLDDAEPRLIWTDPANRALAERVAGNRREVLSIADLAEGQPAPNPGIPVSPDALAFLVYTSGSTGRPKGVMQSHRSVIDKAFRLTHCLGAGPADHTTLLASLSGGQGVTTMCLALLHGMALCPFPVTEKGIVGLADWMVEHGITIYMSSASLFRHFVSTLAPGARFPQVRGVWLASEPATANDVAAYRRHFSDDSFLLHTLSSSETGPIAQLRLTRHDPVADGRLPVGKPLPGVGVLLVNEQGHEVGPGETGELVVRSRHLSPGYWRNEALTAERFSGPVEPNGARVFRSGDLARRTPEGWLVVMGRKDARVKIRGYRIETSEVEEALQQHASVDRAVVYARTLANEDAQLIAYVTFRAGQCSSAEELRQALRDRLPAHMVPSGFVFLDSVPLTPHGKIDREKLLAIQPVPTIAPSHSSLATDTEATLASIWTMVFEGRPVGREDNFFDLGGDSLLAMVVAARVQAALGVELDPRVFTVHPTLAALAALIDELRQYGGPDDLPPLVPVSRSQPLPLSLAQERDWNTQTAEEARQKLIITVHRLQGPLDVAALRSSINYVVRRHEILRTTITCRRGRPVQVVHPPAAVPVPLVDLRPGARPEEQVRELVARETRQPMDLGRLPLVRFWLLRLRPDEHWLVRMNHHIISDGWSWTVFFREVGQLYEASLRGQPPPLPEHEPLQYADFAAWQRRVLHPDGMRYRRLVAWWKQHLAGSPYSLEVPFQRARALPEANPHEGFIWWGISPRISSQLERLTQATGVTHFQVRLAAFVALLVQLTGQPDVVLATAVANRNRLALQNLFGSFADLALLRLRCNRARTFREWLAVVRHSVGETQAHADVSYHQLCANLPRQGMNPPEIRTIFAVTEHTSPVRFGGIEMTWLDRPIGTMPWGVLLAFDRHNEQTRCRVAFDARIYDPAGMRVLIDALVRFLDVASSNPDGTLAELWAASGVEQVRREPPPGSVKSTNRWGSGALRSLAARLRAFLRPLARQLGPGREQPVVPIDWTNWFKLYDVTPILQHRLRIVRAQIRAALTECPAGPIRVVSMCSGDGRDLIGALAEHPRRADVTAWLIDTDAGSLERARSAAARVGLNGQLRFRCADATRARNHLGIGPADVFIVSGVLGHQSNAEGLRFLASLPMFCSPGGCLIWNRHLVTNDGCNHVAAIREALRHVGFEEIEYTATAPNGFACGRARFGGKVLPLDPDRVLFDFVGPKNLGPSTAHAG